MEIEIKLERQPLIKGWINRPDGKAERVIILIHGIGEHIGRYDHWIERFTAKGFAVIGADLPGNGRSGGKRGDISSLEEVNKLIDHLLSVAHEQFPDVPATLYGHSLGGLIVLNWLFENEGRIDKAIVTSPWLKLSFNPPKVKMFAAKVVKSILPKMLQSTGLIADHLSHDKEVVSRYVNDELVHDKISVRHFYDCYTTARKILGHPGKINTRILLMHGSDDKITSPEGSKEFSSISGNTTLKIWDGGYHEIHNEAFADDLFTFITDWLRQ